MLDDDLRGKVTTLFRDKTISHVNKRIGTSLSFVFALASVQPYFKFLLDCLDVF